MRIGSVEDIIPAQIVITVHEIRKYLKKVHKARRSEDTKD